MALLTEQLRIMAEHVPGEVAYKNAATGDVITFAEWEQRSNRLGRGLAAGGVGKGDRVSVYLPPEAVLDWLVAYAAVHKAGGVAVPTNTRLAGREVRALLDHADAVSVITDDRLAANVPPVELLVTDLEQALDPDGSTFQVALTDDDMADIMYTSGTTGRPKGVVVRHRNAAMIPTGMPHWTGAVWLHCSPLFTFAGIASVYSPMKLGLTASYLPRFDADVWLDVVERDRPAMAFLVPAMAQLLIAHPRFDGADLSSLTMVAIGSAPLAPQTLRRLQDRLPGVTVSNGYGMTEAGPAYCAMPPEEARRRIGSVGRPMPPVEFRIVDEAGHELPANEIGELVIRMPGREREYFRDPEATAAMWRDGWLHSGDLAYLDDDGFLYIVGRQKDVIIRGGHNVHAADVEAVLFEHPAVVQAAVAGVPHDVLGEDVAAWVVLRIPPGTTVAVTAGELQSHCAERLADYKVPRRITITDDLPRNATGKVLKQQLVTSLLGVT